MWKRLVLLREEVLLWARLDMLEASSVEERLERLQAVSTPSTQEKAATATVFNKPTISSMTTCLPMPRAVSRSMASRRRSPVRRGRRAVDLGPSGGDQMLKNELVELTGEENHGSTGPTLFPRQTGAHYRCSKGLFLGVRLRHWWGLFSEIARWSWTSWSSCGPLHCFRSLGQAGGRVHGRG